MTTAVDPSPAEGLALLFHSLDQARFGLQFCKDNSVSLPLVTAPGAAAYLGVGWFLATEVQLRKEGLIDDSLVTPDADGEHNSGNSPLWLDCDDATGQAATALNKGCGQIIFTGTGPALQSLQLLAADQGATLLAERFRTFDLSQIDLVKLTAASREAGQRRVLTWLESNSDPITSKA
ncbi:hypothetical protein ACTL6U_07000 [Rhodovibrionaceae bacterium A322]